MMFFSSPFSFPYTSLCPYLSSPFPNCMQKVVTSMRHCWDVGFKKRLFIGKFLKWIDLSIILSVADSIQYNFEKNYQNELLFEKKIQHRIDSVNPMYDHQSPKVRLWWCNWLCSGPKRLASDLKIRGLGAITMA